MIAMLLLLAGMAMLSLAHELGHAATAYGLGLHVTDICIGLGPALVCFERRGIRWMLGPIPLGGFVRVAELAPEATDLQDNGKAWFSGISLAKRMTVILAGPAANYLLASSVALALALGWGIATGRANGLRVVSVDESAKHAGLAAGDLVAQVNRHAIDDLRSLSRALADSSDDGLALLSLRRGALALDLRMPRLRARNGAWGLGAAYVIDPELRQLGLFEGLVHALAEPLLEGRSMIVHGAATLTSSRKAVFRPLGVVGLADRVRSTKSWSVRRVLLLGLSLSVAMGLFNLLPFPGLDGGRLCIEAVQAVRQRRLPAHALIAIQVTGGMILLAAWFLLTAFEIYRW